MSASDSRPFFGNTTWYQALLKSGLIRRAVEALVEAGMALSPESGLGFGHQGDGDLIVRGFFHDLMMQDKAVLVFDDATRKPNSTGTPALPLLIHSVWGWKMEKTFSSCGNGFPLQDPATNLVDLPLGMRQVGIEIRQQRCRHAMVAVQALPGRACPLHVDFGLVDVGLISRFDLPLAWPARLASSWRWSV